MFHPSAMQTLPVVHSKDPGTKLLAQQLTLMVKDQLASHIRQVCIHQIPVSFTEKTKPNLRTGGGTIELVATAHLPTNETLQLMQELARAEDSELLSAARALRAHLMGGSQEDEEPKHEA